MQISPYDSAMENATNRILIIEDHQEDYLLTREMLAQARGNRWTVDWAPDYETGREKMFSAHYQAILVDYALGQHTGLELMREATERSYPAPLILYTGLGSFEMDLEAMQAGATLYLTKSEVNPLLLERAIRYAIEIKQKEITLREREAELQESSAALRASEAHVRARAVEMDALLDAVPAIVWVTHDPEAKNITGNRAAHEFLRVPRGSNLSKSASEGEKPRNFRVYKDGEELAAEALPLQIAAATGKPIRNYEEDVVFDDGSQVHLIGNVTPLLDEDGQPQGAVGAFIDITERSQIERELQEREAQLEQALAKAEEGQRTLNALMDHVPEGITIAAGPDATIRRVSRYGQEILGGGHDEKTAEQVASDWKVYYEDGTTPMPAEELPLMRAIQRGEVVKNVELVQVNAAGKQLPLSCNAGPIRDSSGTIVGGVVAWRDITERKQTDLLLKKRNEELLASEERLRTVIENLPEGLIVVSPDGDALHWNQAALKMHGYQQYEDELSFLSNLIDVYELHTLQGSLVPFENWPVPRLMRRESFEDYELVIKNTKTGWERIFRYYGTPILNSAGELEMGVLAIRDITERKQAQDRLRASEERLAEFLESTHDSFFALDRSWRYVYVNKRFGDVLGLNPREMIGKNIWELFPRYLGTEVEASYRKAMEKRVPVQFQIGGFYSEAWYDISVYPTQDGVSVFAKDRTEEKKALEKLYESEALYRAIARNLPSGGIWVVDLNLRYLAVEGSLVEQLGLNREKLEGHTIQEALDEPARSLSESNFRRALAGEHLTFESEFQGRLLWTHFVPLQNEQGRVLAAMALSMDITERKQAEDHMRMQNEVLASINRIFQEALNRQTEEELGRFCLAVAEQITQSQMGFIGEINDKTGQLDVIAISDAGWQTDNGKPAPTELNIRGLYGWVLQEGKGFYTNDPASHPASVGTPAHHPRLKAFLGIPLIYGDKIIGMLGLGNRPGGYGTREWETIETLAPVIVQAFMNKRAEQALRQSESNLRKLVEGNIIGINIRNADGRIRDANSVFLQMTGYTIEDLQSGKLNLKDLTPTEFWSADQQAVNEVIQTGSCKPYEKEYIHKNGRRIPAMVGYTRLGDSEGDLIGFVLDLSELKASQSKIVEYAEKLQQSNQELEQFAFMASHDLQEPLRKIRLFGNSIYQKLNGNLDESTEDSFQRMINASERMQAMIQDLLELSRVSTQGRPFKPTDLSEVAADVVSDLEPRIIRTGGQVILEPLPTIDADPIQIHQLLQNLISNALKFHKPDTTPVIKVSGDVSRDKSGQQLAVIRVKDNGIGFEEEYFDQILQPFKRLQGRNEFEGNGIGLAIVKKIVDRHHGSITAHSTPDQGSTFIVALPVKQRS